MNTDSLDVKSKDTFRRFYTTHSKKFWFFVFKTCGDHGLADDVFQESFLRLFRAAPAHLNEPQLKAYLYKISVRLIIDQQRKIKRERQYYPEEDVVNKQETSVFLSLDMQRLFELLKPDERTLLWLAYVEGYSHKEIAEITDMKEKSIKVKLFRTRKKFAGILRQKGYTGEES
ncbi:MAG: RNA polymerase sigma factor [bacterium]|nr:RNA polymerase sigma factor [bacterium]